MLSLNSHRCDLWKCRHPVWALCVKQLRKTPGLFLIIPELGFRLASSKFTWNMQTLSCVSERERQPWLKTRRRTEQWQPQNSLLIKKKKKTFSIWLGCNTDSLSQVFTAERCQDQPMCDTSISLRLRSFIFLSALSSLPLSAPGNRILE